jgi:DNA primase
VQVPELCLEWSGRVTSEFFDKPTHRKAFEVLAEPTQEGRPPPTISELVGAAQERGGEMLSRIVAGVAMEPPKSGGEPTRDYAERMFLRLEEFSLKRRADVVRKRLEKLNPVKAPADHESLFEELITLESARRRVREAAEAVGTSP